MADRTVRAIFEARVSGARKGMTDLAGDVDKTGKKVSSLSDDLKGMDSQKVQPEIDLQIDEAKKRLSDLTRDLGELRKQPSSPEVDVKIAEAQQRIREVRAEIKDLTSQKAEVRIDAGIKDAKSAIESIKRELGLLQTLEATPDVKADITDARKRLREAQASLRELNGARATLDVTADTSRAESAVDDLQGDIADAGEQGGADAGQGVAKGIIDALGTIPVAGAVVGVGVAIAGGLLVGIIQGLQVEARRDLFSAQTGLDEGTAARFGRAAGEAYANAYGESIEGNMDVARRALQANIIDSDATDAEIENVIAKLTGIQDLFDYDIQMAVQAVGNAMKTGLVRDADEAFDLITAASQKLPSDDLLETINEYSNQFATLGIDGQQAFGLIVQGAEAGARDTDKVADSLKELGLRIREGTDPAKDALRDLGLDVRDTIDAFQEGGPKATSAIGDVFDALRDLEDKGGNTQEVIASLFGGPGEDLGAALFALDIDKVNEALGGTEGAVGAAQRALDVMADNTATKIESARRNVEVAMDGVKGALAEAFSDEIGGAADWVARNRGPLLQFFIDVINGTIDMALAFADFSARALDAIADISDGLADLIESIPFVDDELSESLRGVADSARVGADAIRDNVPAALEETRSKINDWAGPEILKARIHDATIAMADDMDAFSESIEDAGGTITINGDKKNAEEVLTELTENINAEDGTVTINGDAVPAEDALDVLMALVGASAEDIEVGADTDPADAELAAMKSRADATRGTVKVDADTASAERALANLEKARYTTLNVRVAGVNSVGGLVKGNHDGGLVRGLNAGGRVPGYDPGYDNVMWPLNSGGRVLTQPLTGGEYVVNSRATSENLALLEAINAGRKPDTIQVTSEIPDLAALLDASSRPLQVILDGQVLATTVNRVNNTRGQR